MFGCIVAVPECTGVLSIRRDRVKAGVTTGRALEMMEAHPTPNESVFCLSVVQATLPEEVARVVVACMGPSGIQAPSVVKSAEEMCKVS